MVRWCSDSHGQSCISTCFGQPLLEKYSVSTGTATVHHARMQKIIKLVASWAHMGPEFFPEGGKNSSKTEVSLPMNLFSVGTPFRRSENYGEGYISHHSILWTQTFENDSLKTLILLKWTTTAFWWGFFLTKKILLSDKSIYTVPWHLTKISWNLEPCFLTKMQNSTYFLQFFSNIANNVPNKYRCKCTYCT